MKVDAIYQGYLVWGITPLGYIATTSNGRQKLVKILILGHEGAENLFSTFSLIFSITNILTPAELFSIATTFQPFPQSQLTYLLISWIKTVM